jgi:hypothetical protein
VIQMAAELLRCAYWFNPLLWIVCRRLRLESEHACDDAVLAGGIRGSDYADQLVELARSLHASRQPWFPAPAMARPSSLERRVSAMLNARINRLPMTRLARMLTIVALAAITLPVAAVAQATFSTFSGSVFDPSDALLPATTLTLTNTQTKAKYEVASGRDGRFEFVGLPPGQYAVEAKLPGFATARATLTIAGQDVHQDFTMQVASLEETVTITDGPGDVGRVQTAAKRPLPACSSHPPPAVRGIGGQLRPPARIRNVDPIYPASLQGTKAAETVVLNARIRPDGSIGEIEVEGSPNQAFVDAALGAVREWAFDETLLNCVPIEVPLKVVLNFRPAEPPMVRLQLTLPSGHRPQLGGIPGGLMTVRIPGLGGFGFTTAILDRQTGLVNITLQEGTDPGGRVIGEVSTRVGDPPVKLGTEPEFTVSVMSIR